MKRDDKNSLLVASCCDRPSSQSMDWISSIQQISYYTRNRLFAECEQIKIGQLVTSPWMQHTCGAPFASLAQLMADVPDMSSVFQLE